MGTGSRGSCWGLAALESHLPASAVAETGGVRVVSELLERGTSFPAKPAAPHTLAPLSVAVFQSPSTAEQAAGSWILCLPSTLLSWIMGYFGVPGAGPDLTACVSGRVFSASSLPLPQGNHLCGTYLAHCRQPSL